MVYDLVRKESELEEEAIEYPTHYCVQANSFLEAATKLVEIVARGEHGISVSDLTIKDIQGLIKR